jgi:LysR family transcriptional regulator, hydrogen peroxide-inducible genes activator
MNLPTLRQLEYVVAVADTGQFSEAARVCHVSQPALSKQIRELEDQLGVRLFERVRPKVLATREGARLIAKARRVLLEARELVDMAAASGGLLKGRLTLGVIPTLAPYVLPPLLGPLRREYPALELGIHEAQTDELIRMLREGLLDVLLMAFPVDDRGLTGIDLFEEPFVLAAPPGHGMAKQAPIEETELVGEPLMLMAEGHCFRDHALSICSRAGAYEEMSIQATSITTLALMVANGLGSTLVPALAVDDAFRGVDDVVLRGFGPGGPSRRIGLRWRESSGGSDAFVGLGRFFAAQIDAMILDEKARVFGPKPRIRSLL